MTELYQIYYEESQLTNIFHFSIPYFNQKLTVFFENSVIRELIPTITAEKVGICSWQLKQKVGNGVPMRQPFSEEVINWDYDVLSLGRRMPEHMMLHKLDHWHPGALDTFKKIFGYLNISVREPNDVFYSNHFMARADIYKEYVEKCLAPAMDLMENDKEIRDRCMEDSLYYKLVKNETQYRQRIKEHLGMDYVPCHTFICERMFSVWAMTKKLNVKYL